MATNRPKILVVDDKPANLIALRRLMGRVDAELVEATNGNEALGAALSLEKELALILLDIQMPEMDGFEVAAFLTQEEKTKHIPIIFLTASYKDDYHKIMGYVSGAVDYIEKPIADSILLSKTQVFLDLYSRKVALEQANQRLTVEIAERHRAEQELAKKARELQESNAELQQFAFVASHDLQEPLRMVTQFVQLLERRYGGKLDDEAREYIGFAVDGTKRMTTLIKDLLSYSRVGKRDLELKPVDLGELVETAVFDLQELIRETGGEVEIAADLPTVRGDSVKLVQLLENLIKNALRYHAPARPPRIRLAAELGEDGFWTVSIRDNGIGIEAEYLEKIFVIFQRLHSPKNDGGTGVGLAICKKIVKRHGGRIWVESRPGEGSTFFFTLPGREAEGEGGGPIEPR